MWEGERSCSIQPIAIHTSTKLNRGIWFIYRNDDLHIQFMWNNHSVLHNGIHTLAHPYYLVPVIYHRIENTQKIEEFESPTSDLSV